MSTFRYDTKFRGATTNKGAIKLAPKFVNCPTCGFVRSKDRSKVIAKKSKQYHLFMPPNSGNIGTYYYIAYDGQPEQRFDNSTGFDITCSSIESYAVKFDRGYGSDNFILMIDNGTKPISINPNTQLVIIEDAGRVFIGGGVPITPENLEVTFEDGDSISFNVYTEENIRPAKYNIYFPSNAVKDGFFYISYDDNKTALVPSEQGIDIWADSIKEYSTKFTRSYKSGDAFNLIISNGTNVKSVEPTSEGYEVATIDHFIVVMNLASKTNHTIQITFEDGEILPLKVYCEENYRPAKYNISLPANLLPPEASIKIIADGKNYDIKGSDGYNIYFNTIESYTAVSMENNKFPAVFILDNGTKMKSVSPKEIAEITDVPNLGSGLQMLTLDDSNIIITFEDGDQLDIAIKQKFIKETLNYKLTVTNIETSWDHPYIIEYNNGKSYVEDSIQPGETKEIEMNSLEYLRIWNNTNPIPFKLEHNKGFKIKKVIGFNPEDGFTKDATDYKNTLVSDLTSDNPYIIQAKSGHVSYTVYYEDDAMDGFDIYTSDTPVFLEVFCNTKNTKYVRYGSFNTPDEYICRTDPFGGGGVVLHNNDTLMIDQNESEPEDIDFYIEENKACNDNIEEIKLTLISTDNNKVKVVHDGVYRLRIPAGEQATVTFRVSYRITIGIQNKEYTYTFINI